MGETDLTALPATRLAALVRAREVSAEEVVRAHLERIAALDGGLHAFQALRADAALDEARGLDARADLADLPLAGVPLAVKDHHDVAGLPTRNGSRATSAAPAARDSDLVARLRSAGAVVLGKTCVPELCLWPFTESLAFGATANPWSPTRSPGGSSGGSAAAVAAGMAPLATGSDGGGSIRIPAGWCGIFGIRPGPGVVPQDAPGRNWYGLSENGALAYSVADAAMMLDVMAGREDLRRVLGFRGPLRIAVSTRVPAPLVALEASQAEAVRVVAERLEAERHQVVPADPPYPATLSLSFLHRYCCGIAEEAEPLDLFQLEPGTRVLAQMGRVLRRVAPPTRAERSAWRARVLQWFERFDVLLTPSTSQPPPRVGQFKRAGGIATLLGITPLVPMTPAWNLAALPCASVPGGRTADGLPVGVQLVGPPGSEATLLGLAMELEQMRPWPRWSPAGE